MNPVDTTVAAPVTKAASAIAAGAGSSIISTALSNPTSFLPTDAAGWAALAASLVAAIYNLHLLRELYVKKGWGRKLAAMFRKKAR